jgi:hypothetical protein
VSGKVFQNRLRCLSTLAISKTSLQDSKTPVSVLQDQSKIDGRMRVRYYSYTRQEFITPKERDPYNIKRHMKWRMLGVQSLSVAQEKTGKNG